MSPTPNFLSDSKSVDPFRQEKKTLLTPPKINMEPKLVGLEDDFPFQTGDFQVPALHFPGCQKKRCWCSTTIDRITPNHETVDIPLPETHIFAPWKDGILIPGVSSSTPTHWNFSGARCCWIQEVSMGCVSQGGGEVLAPQSYVWKNVSV